MRRKVCVQAQTINFMFAMVIQKAGNNVAFIKSAIKIKYSQFTHCENVSLPTIYLDPKPAVIV